MRTSADPPARLAGWRWAVPAGFLAAFSFLTRSAALALIVAVVVYLLTRRLTKVAHIFAATVALLAGPWMIYSRAHAPTAEQQAEQNSYIMQSYAQQFWQRKATYIFSLYGPPGDLPRWLRMFDDNEKLIGWVGQNLPRDAVVTSQNPALVHLYTGHKGVGSTDPARNWERWKNLNVRYFVLTSVAPLGEPPEREKRFKELYRVPITNLRVIDFGEAATCPPW